MRDSSDVEIKEPSWCWKLLKRRLSPDNLLFEEGDIYCRLLQKCLPIDTFDAVKRVAEFSCGIANCSQTFDSLLKYESHYNSSHRHVCQTCQKMFPTAHLLEIHVLESHDVMFTLLAEKQNMFQCLLAECPTKFKTSNARKNHMVKMHRYPPNYRYDKSKTSRSKKETLQSSNNDLSVKGGEDSMDTDVSLTTDNSGHQQKSRIFVHKVPEKISFGQGIPRGFMSSRGRGRKQKKHWHNRNPANSDTRVDIETVSMKDLSEALS